MREGDRASQRQTQLSHLSYLPKYRNDIINESSSATETIGLVLPENTERLSQHPLHSRWVTGLWPMGSEKNLYGSILTPQKWLSWLFLPIMNNIGGLVSGMATSPGRSSLLP